MPEETAVALVYDGSTHAVLMATPADLEDLAVGFSLTEGIARGADIREIEIVAGVDGIECRVWLTSGLAAQLGERRRAIVGPTGCGLCGVESLAQAVRPPPRVVASRFSVGEITAAAASLRGRQPLGDATRAVHAAGLWTRAAGLVCLREDVGRHNALDKLAGALARGGVDTRLDCRQTDANHIPRLPSESWGPPPGRTLSRPAMDPSFRWGDRCRELLHPTAIDPSGGIVVLTSRVSVEMVQKAASIGAGAIVAVSAPTALAMRMAEVAGLVLVGVARDDGFEVFAGEERVCQDGDVDPIAR